MSQNKILIVEDEKRWQRYFSEAVKKVGLIPLVASTLREADELFGENIYIVAVIMDGCLSSNEPNSMWLVRKIRNCPSFSGKPIIGATSHPLGKKLLMNAGCTCVHQKSEVERRLREILGL